MGRLRVSPGYNSTSLSPARSPKSQIDSSSYEGGVFTFCLDVGGPKPRADRRAGGWVCREKEISVFSSVGTLCSFRLVGAYSSGLVPLLLTLFSLLSFLSFYVTASDFRKSFPIFVFHITSVLPQNLNRSCWIHVFSSGKRTSNPFNVW